MPAQAPENARRDPVRLRLGREKDERPGIVGLKGTSRMASLALAPSDVVLIQQPAAPDLDGLELTSVDQRPNARLLNPQSAGCLADR
jgi:hypothetical protein